MRAFLVRLPSGARDWPVLDEDLAVVEAADAFLRHVRFGRDGSELTTRSYAGGIALFLRWCARTVRHWHDGVAALGLFITWLRHAGPQASGVDVVVGAQVLAGPGAEPVREARRINGVLTAVRGFVAPTDRRNPGGRGAITGFSLAFAHRTWVDRMPLLRNADGIEYHKSKIVLYAYRHIVPA